ncbi:hypothetical protein [Pseudolabrys sp. FHR47]|uniref:hypothetical protein n=1 Tax=Pseudolabrys sp. FHR47 TaxID=2562284 RepID=UPI0010BF404C|nr:hypothetical protein [Pseudolabrys sp. FHR47]
MANDLREPRASAAKVAYHQNQLLKLFSRANDAAFLQMIWATDALQSGRERHAKRYLLAYPPEAVAESSLRSNFGIHRWELETLLVQLFLVPKELPRETGNLTLDCSKFEAIRQTINRLRSLENVEAARYLSGEFTIWAEMNRIAQRQFHWQRGYFNTPQFYRYAYLYAQGKCAEYFRQTYGLEVSDLMFTGFSLFTAYLNNPWIQRQTSVPEMGLTEEIVQRAFPMLSCSRNQARAETAKLVAHAQNDHGSPIPTALLPSILRKSPLIYVDDANKLVAPIPEAILLRVTAGLYFDLLAGGQAVINDANSRFEQYCAELFEKLMRQFGVKRAYRYGAKGAQFDTPDILIKDGDKLAIVAECKATRLTYLAQFAEDPFEAARKQYSQIAKGVFQLWRFFAHIRCGVVEEKLSNDCAAMIFTLDAYMQIAEELQNKVLTEANALADADGNIEQQDRKHIIICPISDLESILTTSDEISLRESLKASSEPKYKGWMLNEVHRNTGATDRFGAPKPFPFDLADVLPWWKKIGELLDQHRGK